MSISFFSSIINHIEMGRLMSGVQFQVLACLQKVLSSVPEGREAAQLVKTELADARLVNAEHKSSPDDQFANPRLDQPLERIDYVKPHLITALKAALPLFEKAMEGSPNEETVQAFKKLERITALIRTSQSPAVLDPQTVRRVRETVRMDSPAVRYLQRMVSEKGEGRPARVFLFNEKTIHRGDWPGVLGFLSEHFGSEVTRDDLMELSTLPQKDYRMGVVTIRKEESQPLRIAGDIRNGGQMVGFVDITIPPLSPSGSRRVAKVEAISILHKRLGLGSQLLADTALFLHDREVEAMDADAMEDAGLFCVFNAFRTDRETYEGLVADFIDAMRAEGVAMKEEEIQTQLLHVDANLADLAAFQIDRQRVGRAFLKELFTRRYLPVRFELGSKGQSWLQLLSNLCRDSGSPLAPLEWERLSSATRGMLYSGVHFVGGNVPRLMSSDGDHADHLVERLHNWTGVISMFSSYTPAMRERMPEKQDEVSKLIAAVQDVLEMIALDPDSPLFLQFQDRLDPGANGGAGRGQARNHGAVIASLLLKTEKKGFLRIPPVLKALFEDLVSRE